MENSYATSNSNVPTSNGQVMMHSPYQQCVKGLLSWLDLRVFYVRVSKFERSVKFEVFDKDVLVLSGVIESCNSNGFTTESRNHDQRWCMNCKSDITAGPGFLKAKQFVSSDSASPTIEVYVAGTFSGTPIILTKTLQLSSRKKQTRRGVLDSIPEYEASEESQKDTPSELPLQVSDFSDHKPESEYYNHLYSGTDFLEGEDEELSWFNAGVRVGVGIGLSICLGIGIGVGMLVRTYQGTARNFRRRLL
ncbi:Erythronate-4-phosphate dehydrogenase family protein [Citrus sinensis]|nr:Erythronate-4-phosphate dehydrogenase family protein [Citrus sinensis]